MKETSKGLIPETLEEKIAIAKARTLDKVIKNCGSLSSWSSLRTMIMAIYNEEIEELTKCVN